LWGVERLSDLAIVAAEGEEINEKNIFVVDARK